MKRSCNDMSNPTADEIVADLTAAQAEVANASWHSITISPSGAGSGKTRTLTRRAQVAVLSRGVQPRSLWMLTFTQRACAAMTEKLRCLPSGHLASDYVKQRMGEVVVMTLHGAAAAVVSMACAPTTASRETCIVVATALLRANELKEGSLTLTHIMVDEAQDNDTEQHEFVEALLAYVNNRNHCGATVVGDARQAIYGFRGGNVDAFTAMETKYKDQGYDVLVCPLSDNFRSTPQIVAVCNALFAETAGIVPMRTPPGAPVGNKPMLRACRTLADETQYVVSQIKTLIRDGARPDDILVLCRTNAESIRLLATLVACSVPATKTNYVKSAQPGRVSVSTVHGEKGGEASIVFAVGLSDRAYPCANSLDPLDEEFPQKLTTVTDTARAAINVTLSRARHQLYASWPVFSDRATDPPSPASRLLATNALRTLWNVMDDVTPSLGLCQITPIRFRSWGTPKCFTPAFLMGHQGSAERLFFSHAPDACIETTEIVPCEPERTKSLRGAAELLAVTELGYNAYPTLTHAYNASKSLLKLPALTLLRHKLLEGLQNPHVAESEVLVGSSLPWLRGTYSDDLPFRICGWGAALEASSTLLKNALKHEARHIRNVVGTYTEPLSSDYQVLSNTTRKPMQTYAVRVCGRNARTDERYVLYSDRFWGVHDKCGEPSLVTACTEDDDASSLLIHGLLLLAAGQLVDGRRSNERHTTIVLSVAVWDIQKFKLHRIRTPLQPVLDTLNKSLQNVGVLRPKQVAQTW